MKAAIFFLGLLALTAAQTVSLTQSVTAGTASTLNFGNGFSALTNLLPSLSINSNASSSVTVTLSTGSVLSGLLSAATTANFAGGLAVKSDGTSSGVNIFAGADFSSNLASALSGLSAISAVSLTVSSSNPVQLTISGTTGSLAVSGNANLQVGLFTSYSDNFFGTSSSGSSSTTVTGTVPYSIAADGKTYTYTLNVPGGGSAAPITGSATGGVSAFFKPFDSSKAKSSNNGGTAASSGSSSFSSSTGFVPGVFGYDFSLTGGQQYAFGNNIQITPSASSGSAGTININNAGSFSNSISAGSAASGQSAAPAAASSNAGTFFNSYYQVSGSGNTNVMQWSSTPSDASWTGQAFTSVNTSGSASTSSSVTGSAAASAAQAKGTTYSWYKSSTNAGASAAANSWSKVSSTSSADASAGIKVYANVNSYSQWTVASSNSGNAVKATIVTMIVALMVIMF